MDSSVLLSTDGLMVCEDSRHPLELALLAGSILALIGDRTTVAPLLARILSGMSPPASGRILLDEERVPLDSPEARGLVEFVPEVPSFSSRITPREYLSLAAAAAGHGRKKTREILNQVLEWSSLDQVAEVPSGELDRDTRYSVAFAAACLPVPLVLALQGPVPEVVHPLLGDLCRGGSAVVVSVPDLQYLPPGTDRVALCDGREVRKILRFQDFSEICSRMMKLRVRFVPALPRGVMESLPGAGDVVSVPGGYEFTYGVLSSAITNLVNLARANSRQIAGLEVVSPGHDELLEELTLEERTGEADLFCAEDLGI